MSDSENDTEGDTTAQERDYPCGDAASASASGQERMEGVNGHLQGGAGADRSEQKQQPEEMQEIPIAENENRNHSHATDAMAVAAMAMTTEGPAGNIVLNKSMDLAERVQSLRSWGVNKLIKTKQRVKEKLGRSHSRTVDRTLEERIDSVRAQRHNYSQLVANQQRALDQLGQLLQVLRCSGAMHADLARGERALATLLLEQSALQLGSAGALEALIGRLAGTARTLDTLVSKTFDDLLGAVRAYEEARVELDAYQTELERLAGPAPTPTVAPSAGAAPTVAPSAGAAPRAGEQPRLRETRAGLEASRLRYEASKANLEVKLDLLEEHKNRVIERELASARLAWQQFHWQCHAQLARGPDERARAASTTEQEGEPVRH